MSVPPLDSRKTEKRSYFIFWSYNGLVDSGEYHKCNGTIPRVPFHKTWRVCAVARPGWSLCKSRGYLFCCITLRSCAGKLILKRTSTSAQHPNYGHVLESQKAEKRSYFFWSWNGLVDSGSTISAMEPYRGCYSTRRGVFCAVARPDLSLCKTRCTSFAASQYGQVQESLFLKELALALSIPITVMC